MIRWHIKVANLVLSCDPKIFAAAYFVVIVVLSLAFDHVDHMPDFYLVHPDNVFNVYVFKSSYNYTIAALMIFSVAAICALDHYRFDNLLQREHVRDILRPVGRLAVSWLLFYVVKRLIDVLAVMHGQCKDRAQYDNQQLLCVAGGHEWIEYRASGHAFYLLYSMLLILEETRVFKYWCAGMLGSMTTLQDERTLARQRARPPTEIDKLISSRNWYNYECFGLSAPFITITYTLLAVWMVLLHLNMFVTVAYHHKAEQKAIGAALAILLWFCTYGFIFKLEVDVFSDEFRKPRTSTTSTSSGGSRKFFYPYRGPRSADEAEPCAPSTSKSTSQPPSPPPPTPQTSSQVDLFGVTPTGLAPITEAASESGQESVSQSTRRVAFAFVHGPPPTPSAPDTESASQAPAPSADQSLSSSSSPQLAGEPAAQSTDQPVVVVVEPAVEAAPQPAIEAVPPAAVESVLEPLPRPTSALQLTSEPAVQPVIQPTVQSAPQSTSEPAIEPAIQAPAQSAPQATVQSVSEPANETIINERAAQG